MQNPTIPQSILYLIVVIVNFPLLIITNVCCETGVFSILYKKTN